MLIQIYNDINDDDDDHDGDDADDNIENTAILNSDTVFELIDVGDYIGLRTPVNALEPFYVAEILHKGIAENNLRDQYGHYILTGEKYAEICYLQEKREGKQKIIYERTKSITFAYILIAEIFITNIELDVDLKMSKTEYQSIVMVAL